MTITMIPIGIFHTDETEIPRHWSVSDKRGRIVIDPAYTMGLKDICAGQKIMVIFHFHRSEPFDPALLVQKPPHKDHPMGVFSICSPRRPNPIGLSVLTVTGIQANIIHVEGIDMIDGTPILDLKPCTT